jgi:deoxyribonuclease-4
VPLFGSHLSIAGGYYKAVLEAGRLGFDCVQIFTKNNNQWRAKPITDAEAEAFRCALAEQGVVRPISHNSYLINLASPDDALRGRSIDAMVVELERAHRLGIDHVVAHPGSHVGAGEEAGLTRVAEALDLVFQRTASLPTTVALENTAGQGSNLGHRFEHLTAILERCSRPERLRVCVDTCHVFAAGYPLAPKRKYLDTLRKLDRAVDLERVVAWHLNDSKRALGSRVDRHEHIGRGCLGLEPFRLLVRDRRFREAPMYLETPKGVDPKSKREWDAINLSTLRRLAAGRA